MIVDTSVIMAILLKEQGASDYARSIYLCDLCRMSAANFVELSIVLKGRIGPRAKLESDLFLAEAKIFIEPVTHEHAILAHQAFVAFGKGRHPAGLNFGDCFAYALAKATGEPLLFKGEDFSKTDLVSAT